jgi:polyisoprenyl-teichoic acid--peptidoglycan teichoic acid transferase
MTVSTLLSPQTNTPAFQDESPRPPRWHRRLTTLLVGAVVLGLAVFAAAAVYLMSVDHAVNSNLARGDTLPMEVPVNPAEAPRPAKAANDALNYLIIGSDTSTGSASRGQSDLLMVAHLAADRSSAAMISLPADLRVDIPGHGKNRINTASTFGGPQLTVRTVEGLLGVRMDHVVQVDYDGFMKLTKELGGVTVENKQSSTSAGHEFPEGTITLDSDEALAYVRQRDLPGGDLARTERQRQVMEAILRKTLSPSTVANPAKFNRIAGSVAKKLTVDRELSAAELRRAALSVRFKPNEVRSLQLPVSRYSDTKGPRGLATVDQEKLKVLATALSDDDLDRYPNG